MSLLIFALIVILIVGLLIWAVDSIPLGSPVNQVAKVIIILVGVMLIVSRAGLL